MFESYSLNRSKQIHLLVCFVQHFHSQEIQTLSETKSWPSEGNIPPDELVRKMNIPI